MSTGNYKLLLYFLNIVNKINIYSGQYNIIDSETLITR